MATIVEYLLVVLRLEKHEVFSSDPIGSTFIPVTFFLTYPLRKTRLTYGYKGLDQTSALILVW